MPDEYGNLKGISVPAAAWERIFGREAQPEKTRGELLDEIARIGEELETATAARPPRRVQRHGNL